MELTDIESGKRPAGRWRYAVSYPGSWAVLVGVATLLFALSPVLMLPPLIYGPVIEEFGWTRGEATLFSSYNFLASALTALFLAGPLIDKFGLKRVMVWSNALLALAMIAVLTVNSRLFYYSISIVFGFASTVIMIGIKVLVSRWYSRNQGVAIGITLAATSFGGLLIPPVGNALIEAYDWRAPFAIMSIAIWAVVIPLFVWKARPYPTAEDILPEALHQTNDHDLAEAVKKAELDTAFSDVLKTPMFWFITGALFIVGCVDNGMLQHTALYLGRDLNMGSTVAALGIAGTFGLGIVAKLLFGWIFDRLSIKGIMLCYVFLSLSVALAFTIVGPITLIMFTVSRGLAHGGLLLDTTIYAKHCYGNRHLSKALGILTGITLLGFAAGPAILSALHERFGNYKIGFLFFALIALLAAMLLIRVRPLYLERLKTLEENHLKRG